MKILHIPRSLTTACGAIFILSSALHAGAPTPDFKSGKDISIREGFAGSVTTGARFSDHLIDGYLDLLLPAWASTNHMLAFSTRVQAADNDQNVYSFGVVWRYLVPNRDLIIGVNAFYDYLESQHGNHFDQLGVGAELLSKWVDARFNYYLPDSSSYIVGQKWHQVGKDGTSHFDVINGVPTKTTEKFITNQRTRLLEAGLEGFYTEAGVLIPGLDKYVETRIFGGYYHYNNPFGHDFRGFQARLEAQVLQGVVAELDYFEDKYFAGGHWVAGVRASVPFEIGNLFRGKNPFEGAGDAFRPGHPREFRDRMGDMVLRSPRVKTVTGTDKDTFDKTKTTLGPLPTGATANPENPEQIIEEGG